MSGYRRGLKPRAARCFLALLALVFTAAVPLALRPARGETLERSPESPADSVLEVPEPPPEATPEADYESERGDSIAAASAEVMWGYSGRGSSAVRERRSVRLRESGLEAVVREGRDDPLAGVGARAAAFGGWISVGRARSEWGRGLVIGVPREPWRGRGLASGSAPTRVAAEAGEFRRSSSATGIGCDIVLARTPGTRVAGAAFDRAGISLGIARAFAVAGPARTFASLSIARGSARTEAVVEDRGRWMAEGSWPVAEGRWRASISARQGAPGYRSPLAARPGPNFAIGATLERVGARLSAAGAAAIWRFADGSAGARAALEVSLRLPQHDVVVLGGEERHGPRRADLITPAGFRQGAWAEWRGGGDGLALSLRHERWGRRGGLGDPVRRLAQATIATRPLTSLRIAIAHTVYGAREETQYLEEVEVDRRTLRALRGTGRRTRIEARLRAGGGDLTAALHLVTAARSSPPQWTVTWTRSARTREGTD